MVHAQRGSIDLVQELLYHHANVDLQDEVMEILNEAIIHALLERTHISIEINYASLCNSCLSLTYIYQITLCTF